MSMPNFSHRLIKQSSHGLIYFISHWLSNDNMKLIDDIRRDNMAALRDEHGGTAGLAKQLERSESQVSQWIHGSAHSETGKQRGMRPDSARYIERKCGKPVGWLDVEHVGVLPNIIEISSAKKPSDSVVFNLLDARAACGNGAINAEYPEIVRTLAMSPGEAQRLIGSTNRSGSIQIIAASKDSMTPEIQPDDLLFVDTAVREYAGEAVYILLHGGELVCKRLSLVGKTLTVSSDNKAYPSWPWNERPGETAIVGRVLRVLPMTFKKFGSI